METAKQFLAGRLGTALVPLRDLVEEFDRKYGNAHEAQSELFAIANHLDGLDYIAATLNESESLRFREHVADSVRDFRDKRDK